MPQTGKTPKKTPSAAQEEFRQGYKAGRKADTKFSMRGFSASGVKKYLAQKRDMQRDRQTSGRMSFEKMNENMKRGYGPNLFQYTMDKAAGLEFYPGQFSKKQYSEPPYRYERFYPSHKSLSSLGDLEVEARERKLAASKGVPVRKIPSILNSARGPYEAGKMMGGQRYPLTRNRPRGKTVTGMMTAPFAAGAGALLRQQMMKQQPNKNK